MTFLFKKEQERRTRLVVVDGDALDPLKQDDKVIRLQAHALSDVVHEVEDLSSQLGRRMD